MAINAYCAPNESLALVSHGALHPGGVRRLSPPIAKPRLSPRLVPPMRVSPRQVSPPTYPTPNAEQKTQPPATAGNRRDKRNCRNKTKPNEPETEAPPLGPISFRVFGCVRYWFSDAVVSFSLVLSLFLRARRKFCPLRWFR